VNEYEKIQTILYGAWGDLLAGAKTSKC